PSCGRLRDVCCGVWPRGFLGGVCLVWRVGFWATPPAWGSVVVWEDVMDEIVSGGGPLVLDGGLATRLEAYGCDLRGDLWSARLLTDAPELIRQAHRDFFEA